MDKRKGGGEYRRIKPPSLSIAPASLLGGGHKGGCNFGMEKRHPEKQNITE